VPQAELLQLQLHARVRRLIDLRFELKAKVKMVRLPQPLAEAR
jgi:hypothetical protein